LSPKLVRFAPVASTVAGRFPDAPEAVMPTQIKARTYGFVIALVGALAATGGNFNIR
jgi:hypothetical protein